QPARRNHHLCASVARDHQDGGREIRAAARGATRRPRCPIELTDEATKWLIANGYDELMGARPMARVIQEHIKKALADEVLFGRLKGGGHVRVIVVTDEAGNSKLTFDYPDGPVTPRQEKLVEPRHVKPKRRSTPRRKPSGPRRNDTPPRGSSVPNVPLVKV